MKKSPVTDKFDALTLINTNEWEQAIKKTYGLNLWGYYSKMINYNRGYQSVHRTRNLIIGWCTTRIGEIYGPKRDRQN
jgi:hypothetical protein